MKNILTVTILIFAMHVSAQTTLNWNNAMDVASNATGNLHPRIALDRNNNPLILWGHSTNAMFSRWNGTSFTTPVSVNPMSIPIFTASWAGPDIASKGDTVYVVFKESPETTGKIYVVHSYDGGVNFSTPVQVDFIADSVSRFPTVTVDDAGNPLIGFMKFNSSFGDSRWVVAKSTDFGNSFLTDVKASGFSGGEICDCCPGQLVSAGNTVAMLYRDNLNNIRDTWVGVSTNGANSFNAGINLDQNNWMLMSCPSTGPDGVLINDTLYSVFMSQATGDDLVYWSKASISNLQCLGSATITGMFTGLTQQNYPRIANYNNAAAIVWKQAVSGSSQLGIYFTSNIQNGLPLNYDTVATGNLNEVVNTDVAVSNGKVYVVWEDNVSGTVKYRDGTFTIPENINVISDNTPLTVYPNPAGDYIILDAEKISEYYGYSIMDVEGNEMLYSGRISGINHLTIDVSNLPDGTYILQPWACYLMPAPIKFIIQRTK